MIGRRFLSRLGDGVPRERLIEPLLTAKPTLLLISAPSGYGKTVLAAQIALAQTSGMVMWIDGQDDNGSVESVLSEICSFFDSGGPNVCAADAADLKRRCDAELAALPDDSPVIVVVDDASWAGREGRLIQLGGLLEEAPPGSLIIVTTRSQSTPGAKSAQWAIGAEELLFTDDEIAAYWALVTGKRLSDPQLAWLKGASGRHPALLSLMARKAALSGCVQTQADQSVSELIGRLASQLTVQQMRTLHYASTVGDGLLGELQTYAGEQATSALRAAAVVLPLISLDEDALESRYSIHSTVGEALGSVGWLASHEPEALGRLVEGISAGGRRAKALHIALASVDQRLVADTLCRDGRALLAESDNGLVQRAINWLPASLVSGSPQLMGLSAEAMWAAGDYGDAIRVAQLSARMAEHMGQSQVAMRIRLVLARFRASMADYADIPSELAPVLPLWRDFTDVDDVVSLVVSARVAYLLDGDNSGIRQCASIEDEIRQSGRANELALSRFDVTNALVEGLLRGDWVKALEHSRVAAMCEGLTLSQKASAICNLAAAAHDSGSWDECRRAVSFGSTLVDSSTHADAAASFAAMNAVMKRLADEETDVVSPIEYACLTARKSGNLLDLVTTYLMSASEVLLFRNAEYADVLADRAVRTAMTIGSPTVLWMAQLLQAQARAALGDLDTAKETAQRVLPWAQEVGAGGHVLHVRLLSALISLEHGEQADAVRHLSLVAEYVADMSPGLTVTSYLRAFPQLLGPLAMAMGVDRIPASVLCHLRGSYAEESIALARKVLAERDLRRLIARLRADGGASSSEEIASPILNIRLFGGLEVTTPKGLVADRDWGKRKARLLFAMLVARSGTDVSRGELIEHLWPEMEEDRALNNFYVVWSAMKRAISPESVREAPCPFVEHVHGVCRVVPGRVVTDLDQFRAHLAKSRRARIDGDPEAELASIMAAADLYRGELLPGDVYDDWFGPLRERYKHDFEDAMLRAAQIFSDKGQPHEALSVLRRALTHDPWREDLYQAALRTQIGAGQRSAAIDTYMSCRSRLVEDLGIDPSRETTLLYEQVLGMEE